MFTMRIPRALTLRIALNTRQMSSRTMDQDIRDRIHVNALTFGSPGCGKTTLNSELTKISHDNFGRVPHKTLQDIDRVELQTNKKKSNVKEGSKNVTHLEWDTSLIRVAHTDVPTASAYVKNFLTHISNIDAALWVIDANEGVLEDAVTQYKVIKHMSPLECHVIPFISNEPHPDVLELIKMDLEEILTSEEHSNILSSPVQVPILMDKLFTSNKIDSKDTEPLLWYLENVGNIPSKGTFVAGRLEQGIVKDQETVMAFYKGSLSPVTIRSCEIFRRPVGYLKSKERGGAYIRIKQELQFGFKKGGVLMKGEDDKIRIGATWEVELSSEKERNFKGSQSIVLIHKTTYDGTCKLEEKEINLIPGKSSVTKISLSSPIVAKKMDPFLLRLSDIYVYGVFKNVID